MRCGEIEGETVVDGRAVAIAKDAVVRMARRRDAPQNRRGDRWGLGTEDADDAHTPPARGGGDGGDGVEGPEQVAAPVLDGSGLDVGLFDAVGDVPLLGDGLVVVFYPVQHEA